MTRTNNRALANWPNNAVSVLDFGAVGDGVVNDSPAIKTALEWLFSEQNSQKSLYVPSGIYNLETAIELSVNPNNSQLAIYGDGATSVFHCKDVNGGIKINTFSNAVYLTLDSLQFCPGEGNGGTAHALWFTYDNRGTKNRHQIWMRNCVVDTLSRDNFSDGWVDVFKFHSASRVKIQDTTIWNVWKEVDASGDPVGKMIDLYDCYKPWLKDIYCNGAGKYGVYNLREGFNEGGNYNNVNIVGPSIGIFIQQNPTTSRHPEVWIKDSHMNCKAENISITGCKYVWIKDCLLYGAPSTDGRPGSPTMRDIFVDSCIGVNIIGNVFGSGSLTIMDRRHVFLEGTSQHVNISKSQLDAPIQQKPFFFRDTTHDITFHQEVAPIHSSYFTDQAGAAVTMPGYLVQGNVTDSVYVYRYATYYTG